MFGGKPIIGVAGGIGSGKTFVAHLFGEIGCRVISADDLVSEAYKDHKVKQTLRRWWGPLVFDAKGAIDRSAVARIIFTRPDELRRLEQLIHPLVSQLRERLMQAGSQDAQVLAFVWDTPLLFETGLNQQCDAVVFVDAPRDLRLQRLVHSRGWEPAELERRENLQMPLDKKREISDHVVVNVAGADEVRAQVREVLTRVLAGMLPRTNQ